VLEYVHLCRQSYESEAFSFRIDSDPIIKFLVLVDNFNADRDQQNDLDP